MPSTVDKHQRAIRAAVAQAGVLSRHQLIHLLDWSPAEIRTQLDAFRWQRVFDGVYAVTTGDLSIGTRWWAAHLRCGEASALTGETALHAWNVAPASDEIEMSVPITASARTPGVTIHRTRIAPPTRNPNGLPPTVVPQAAVLMVTDRLSPTGVMDLVSRACQRGLTSPRQLRREMVGRRLKHRRLITELLVEVSGGSTTPLEIAGTRNVLKSHGIPIGDGQVRERLNGQIAIRDRVIGSLVIEFDGRLGHSDPASRFRDSSRDNAAAMTGRITLRFGWTDVHEYACDSALQVLEALERLGTRVDASPCSSACALQAP